VLQPVLQESDCKAARRKGFVNVGNKGCVRSRLACAVVLNRVFYKELKEGACKIVDENIILLT